MQCVLGVDGGNTKTIALVAALDGRILGTGRSGCSDIYNARRAGKSSEEAALEHLEEAVLHALHAAEAQPSDLLTAVYNMAGADWPEDFHVLRSGIQARGFGQRVQVQNDALGILHDRVSSSIGVSVVCGTGGAVGARGPDGRTWHSSRWQDEVQGSYQLGQKALYAIYRSALGIDPPTSLTGRVLDLLQMPSVEAVLHHFTSREHRSQQHRQDRLTPLLLDEAQAGDAAARQIVEAHGQALGNFALVAARCVGLENSPFALALAGGVFRHPSPLLPEVITETVRQSVPAVCPMRSRFEPIVGVLFSALEAAGVEVSEALVERLLPTLPAASFYTGLSDGALVAAPEGGA
jgi:N-acetylglucosamine kinase-like BadF-type ATPase